MTIACAVCMRLVDGAAVHGLHAGVITLVAVTAVVLAAFGRFAVRIARRQ